MVWDGMGGWKMVEDGGRWWKVGWDWLWFIGNHCVGLRGCPKYHEQAKEPLIYKVATIEEVTAAIQWSLKARNPNVLTAVVPLA